MQSNSARYSTKTHYLFNSSISPIQTPVNHTKTWLHKLLKIIHNHFRCTGNNICMHLEKMLICYIMHNFVCCRSESILYCYIHATEVVCSFVTSMKYCLQLLFSEIQLIITFYFKHIYDISGIILV